MCCGVLIIVLHSVYTDTPHYNPPRVFQTLLAPLLDVPQSDWMITGLTTLFSTSHVSSFLPLCSWNGRASLATPPSPPHPSLTSPPLPHLPTPPSPPHPSLTSPPLPHLSTPPSPLRPSLTSPSPLPHLPHPSLTSPSPLPHLPHPSLTSPPLPHLSTPPSPLHPSLTSPPLPHLSTPPSPLHPSLTSPPPLHPSPTSPPLPHLPTPPPLPGTGICVRSVWRYSCGQALELTLTDQLLETSY